MTTANWQHGRLADLNLPPGPYWFTGLLLVRDAISGPLQIVIDSRHPELLYIAPTATTWGKYRIEYARGLYTPDTGAHPGHPPENAWPTTRTTTTTQETHQETHP